MKPPQRSSPRAADARGIRSGQAGGRAVGLPGLPQDRRQRQRRPGPAADQHRGRAAQAGDRAHAGQPDGADAVVQEPAAGRSSTRSSPSCRSSTVRPAHAARAGGPTLPARSRSRRCGRCSTASPASMTCMNTAMTAGLHHRWRARAADLARWARAAARSTSPAARATWRSSSPRAWAERRGGGLRLLRRDARARPAQGPPAIQLRPGRRAGAALRGRCLRRGHRRLRRAQLRRPRQRPGRDGARGAAGRARRRARDHHAAAAAAVAGSTGCGSTAWCPCSGAPPGRPTPTATCPTRCSASPVPTELAGSWSARASGGSARC